MIYRIFRGISMLFTAPSERESPQAQTREPSVPTSSKVMISDHISDDSLQNCDVPYAQLPGKKNRQDRDNSPQFPRRETSYRDERPAEVRFNRM